MGKSKMPMLGRRFGRLVVLYEVDTKTGNRLRYMCRCDCGSTKSIDGGHLRSGKIKSCGCLWRENLSRIHMDARHPGPETLKKSNPRLYRIWCAMKARCYNCNVKAYPRYGGRGIEVCEEWRNDFNTFCTWALAHGYAEHLDIDRKDNEKGYSPDNCQWLTRSENSKKRARDKAAIHKPI